MKFDIMGIVMKVNQFFCLHDYHLLGFFGESGDPVYDVGIRCRKCYRTLRKSGRNPNQTAGKDK